MIQPMTGFKSVDRRGRRIFELRCGHWVAPVAVKPADAPVTTVWCPECESRRAGKGIGVDDEGPLPEVEAWL